MQFFAFFYQKVKNSIIRITRRDCIINTNKRRCTAIDNEFIQFRKKHDETINIDKFVSTIIANLQNQFVTTQKCIDEFKKFNEFQQKKFDNFR